LKLIEFYQQHYQDRWQKIQESLSEEVKFPWKNPWVKTDHRYNSEKEIPRDENQLLAFYVLSPASFFVAQQLAVKAKEKVLDMCAAPGGKSLSIAETLFVNFPDESSLICNELNPTRRERLTSVIQQYIPRNIREKVWVKGLDGVKWGIRNKNEFHKILLDAPCSGDAHRFVNKDDWTNYSVKQSQRISVKQMSLLCSAWDALAVGGRLVYSTCTMSPFENEELISKFLKKRENVSVIKSVIATKELALNDAEKIGVYEELHSKVEPLEHGFIFLPDVSDCGPMYFCILQK